MLRERVKKGSFFKTQKSFFLFALIIFLVLFDQFSKYLIEANFNLYESINIFPFLNFTFIKNFGGAFNLFNNGVVTRAQALFYFFYQKKKVHLGAIIY